MNEMVCAVQRECLEAEKERDVNTKKSAVDSHQEGRREVEEK